MEAPVASVIIRAEVGGRKGGWIQGHSQASLAQSGCLIIYISPFGIPPAITEINAQSGKDGCVFSGNITESRAGGLIPASASHLGKLGGQSLNVTSPGRPQIASSFFSKGSKQKRHDFPPSFISVVAANFGVTLSLSGHTKSANSRKPRLDADLHHPYGTLHYAR